MESRICWSYLLTFHTVWLIRKHILAYKMKCKFTLARSSCNLLFCQLLIFLCQLTLEGILHTQADSKLVSGMFEVVFTPGVSQWQFGGVKKVLSELKDDMRGDRPTLINSKIRDALFHCCCLKVMRSCWSETPLLTKAACLSYCAFILSF